MIVASTYTNGSGMAEFMQVRSGQYELIVTAGLDTMRHRLQVNGGPEIVDVRISAPAAPKGGDGNSISVAQYQVPSKARKALTKAKEAITRRQPDEAEKHIARALELHPPFAEAFLLRGILRLDAKKLEGAEADFQKALEADAGYAMAHIALGSAYNQMSRFDDALRELDRGVALSPVAWQGYFEMGKAFMGKGDYHAALRQLTKAETFSAGNPFVGIHLLKAHALLALKDYSLAMAELQAYLDRDPNGSNALGARQTMEKVRAFVALGQK
jgi:tetratricopeptide (TPR) repeat protein